MTNLDFVEILANKSKMLMEIGIRFQLIDREANVTKETQATVKIFALRLDIDQRLPEDYNYITSVKSEELNKYINQLGEMVLKWK